jgi:hypothetical protein
VPNAQTLLSSGTNSSALAPHLHLYLVLVYVPPPSLLWPAFASAVPAKDAYAAARQAARGAEAAFAQADAARAHQVF